MANPWLAVPLADYEGHMQAPDVAQLHVLAELFAQALAYCRPNSVAIIGIAGGNGLDRIDPSITARIVGLDIHPDYLAEARRRFAPQLALDLHCVDLAAQEIYLHPVQLVHAALVFEHAGTDLCLRNALSLVAPGGVLSVVLQLPSESAPAVAGSPFSSMQKLKAAFSLVDPTWLCQNLAARNFQIVQESRHALPAGKSFWHGLFRQQTPGNF